MPSKFVYCIIPNYDIKLIVILNINLLFYIIGKRDVPTTKVGLIFGDLDVIDMRAVLMPHLLQIRMALMHHLLVVCVAVE